MHMLGFGELTGRKSTERYVSKARKRQVEALDHE
jgi:hypothetical protein